MNLCDLTINTAYSYLSHAPEEVQMVAGLVAEYMPQVGALKSFQEAKDPFELAMAVFDAVGGPLGNEVKSSIKAAKAAHEAGDAAEAVKQLKNAEELLIRQNYKSGRVFQTSAAKAMDVPENKHRITVTGRLGESITIIPDATIGGLKGTLVEFKNVIDITDTKQFRGYEATGRPIILVVSERTKTISKQVRDMVLASGNSTGEIRVFNQVTGAWSEWK